MGFSGRDFGHLSLAHRVDRLHHLRHQLQQLRQTYGSLGGAIILLTWLYLSSFIVLLGAAINAQSEKQTRKDSTVGQPEPLGQRDAKAADTVGPSRR